MAFDLKIDFVGMSLFVPDPDTGTLHVLMPAMSGHVARLCFDTASLQSGAAEAKGVQALVPLDRAGLPFDLAGEIDLTLPAELAPVGAVANRPVDLAVLFGDDPAGKLTARARVGRGACSGWEPGACWIYPAPPMRAPLTNWISWTVKGIERDRLDLGPVALSGSGVPTLPPLYPIGGELAVSLYHSTRDELPPGPVKLKPPRPGTKADHFAALYNLFDPPVVNGPLPEFYDFSCGHPLPGGSPFTCLAGWSPLTP